MDNNKLTPEEQFFNDKTLEFTKELYDQNDDKLNEAYKSQKDNRDNLLSKIAKIMMSYNISDSIMNLGSSEKANLYSQLADLISNNLKSELDFEHSLTKGILTSVGKEKYNVNNYIYSLGIDFKITQLNDEDLEKIINTKVDEKLWSDRLYDNKNDMSKVLKNEVKKFLNGDTNVNEIEDKIKKKYNENAYNTKRLVQDNICRVQEGANDEWQHEHNIKYVMYMATLDGHVCSKCAQYDGEVFPLDEKPVQIPQHPFCRCVYVSLHNKDWHPKMRLDNETKKNINWQSYQEWHKNYIEDNPERLANENMIKNKSSDKRIYDKYKDILGKEMPKALEDFQKLKYNNSNEWDLMKDYVKSRSNNMISAFNSFSDYKKHKDLIENEIVGLTTSNGIKITGQSKHFIERVLGTTEDPHTGRPRSGVEINNIKDAIQNGNIRTRKNDADSIKFITEKCIVSINPNTGLLIQVNPQ